MVAGVVQHRDIMELKQKPNQVLHVKSGYPMCLINQNIGPKMPQQRMIIIIAGKFQVGSNPSYNSSGNPSYTRCQH